MLFPWGFVYNRRNRADGMPRYAQPESVSCMVLQSHGQTLRVEKERLALYGKIKIIYPDPGALRHHPSTHMRGEIRCCLFLLSLTGDSDGYHVYLLDSCSPCEPLIHSWSVVWLAGAGNSPGRTEDNTGRPDAE